MATASITKLVLSGSTDGKGIKVVQTATAGTTIHTAHATSFDEIWIWATNNHTADVKLTLEFGSATAVDDNIVFTVPVLDGLYLCVPGLILTNSTTVKAFAATANVIAIRGFVNRIT